MLVESANTPKAACFNLPDELRWREIAATVAEQYGTPSYITRWQPICTALEIIDSLKVDGVCLRSWLSFKTHPMPALVRAWIATGRGVEVVSEYEFVTARALKCSTDQLLVNGVAKHTWLHRHPLARLRVHFDSPGEVASLLRLAVDREWRVGVRLHVPDERDGRNACFGGQFGMTIGEAVASICRLRDAGADLQSVHFHVGQGHQRQGAYVRGIEHVSRVCHEAAFRPRIVDLGGALPSAWEAAEALEDLRDALARAQSQFSPDLEELWLENGRFVSEQSSILVVRVLDVKKRADSRYLICDGGRTNHALAADNGLHPLFLIPRRNGRNRLTTVCGPTCMTDDRLGRMELPDDVGPGDLIAWMNAGAYHLPWETRFSQGLCAVVWCDADDNLSLARERESPDAWVRPWTV